jgi:hypothetical protein
LLLREKNRVNNMNDALGLVDAGDPDFRFIGEDHVLAHDADLKRAAADGLHHSGAVPGVDR